MGLFGMGGKKGRTDDPKKVWEQFFKTALKSDWDKALSLLGTLKTLEPENPQVYIKTGDILQRKGRTKEAVASYHKAADILTVGISDQKAIAIYRIIMRIKPDDENAVRSVKRLLGEPAEAPAPKAKAQTSRDTGAAGIPFPAGTGIPMDGPTGFDAPHDEPGPEAPVPGSAPAFGAEGGGAGLYDFTGDIGGDVGSRPSQPPEEEAPAEAAAPPPSTGGMSLVGALKRHVLFSALSDEQIATLPERGVLHTHEEGRPVIREDEEGDSVFFIKSGTARVTSSMFGKQYELAMLQQGDFFGESGFLTGMPRTATVWAHGTLETLEISKALLNELAEANPEIIKRMVEISHSRSRSTIDML